MDKKTEKERKIAFESLPPAVRESLSAEEKEMFLTADEWTDELFAKLDEFIIKE
ncbi:MAG: hypothetical protein MI892_11145 [Desulfobacterales bacterium]|nr:hypothetical protein [Desulfobacterales bacterium]